MDGKISWQDIARTVIENGRVEDNDPETLENEVIFEAQEQGASLDEAQKLACKARAWFER